MRWQGTILHVHVVLYIVKVRGHFETKTRTKACRQSNPLKVLQHTGTSQRRFILCRSHFDCHSQMNCLETSSVWTTSHMVLLIDIVIQRCHSVACSLVFCGESCPAGPNSLMYTVPSGQCPLVNIVRVRDRIDWETLFTHTTVLDQGSTIALLCFMRISPCSSMQKHQMVKTACSVSAGVEFI